MPAASRRSSAHERELVESRDEILIGEVIAAMVGDGYPVIGVAADVDYQRIRFYARGDAALHSIVVAVDRVRASRHAAALTMQAESREPALAPEELLERSAAHARSVRSPRADGIRLHQEAGALWATARMSIRVEGLRADPGLPALLRATITELRGALERA